MTIFLVAAISALVISFICSLAEACLLSLSLADIANISENKPYTGRIWKKFRENIQKPISVILIINTLAHTIGAATSGVKFSELFGAQWIALYSIAFSLMMIQFTEILPKTIGVRYNIVIAKMGGVVLNFLVKVFTPLLFLVELVNRPFEGGKERKISNDALDEISVLARFAYLNKLISKEQEKIVSRSLNITKVTATDIMVKREDIKVLSTDMELMDALIAAHMHHHTRYPLTEKGDLDNITGYVNFKDIVVALRINPQDPTLKGIVRPILRIKQNENLSVILGRMTQGHHHIAVVEDHLGKTIGLVTMEDAIEPIVGDIEDEYDIIPGTLIQTTGNTYIAGGSVLMQTLRDRINSNLPEAPATLDEWLHEQMKKHPQVNEKVAFGTTQFTVKKMRRDKIYEVIIQR